MNVIESARIRQTRRWVKISQIEFDPYTRACVSDTGYINIIRRIYGKETVIALSPDNAEKLVKWLVFDGGE